MTNTGAPSVQSLPFERERLILPTAFVIAVIVLLVLALTIGDDGSGGEDPDGQNVLGSLLAPPS